MDGTHTTCPYCGVGCGIQLNGGRANLSVTGINSHPANLGRLCSKGSALGETIGLNTRLLTPQIAGNDARWDEAIARIAQGFTETVEKHGPNSVALYVSGQLLSEDYYLANKWMKGALGSANMDTNSRLCMASAVAAHKLAFGEDVVPGCYEDLDLADLIVFAGHNAAFTHPVLYRRMEVARAKRQRHIVIDPRRTDTAKAADLFLPILPQMDVRLFNGLAAFLIAHDKIDQSFLERHVDDYEQLKTMLFKHDHSIGAIAYDCGIAEKDITLFYQWFADTEKTTTLFSQGINQSSQGTHKGLAIINTHLLTGRIGKPGASPFSITGQPNAMGGREVGGMANTLAAHMEFCAADVDRLARFWGLPKVAATAGRKAVDMFDAVESGEIKAIWIMATNPILSLPAAGKIEQALAKCDFVVVSEVVHHAETLRYADVALPALAWGEKDGTVTNSERLISRQRGHFIPPGQAKPDWYAIAEVAKAMGFHQQFSYDGPSAIFAEYARQTNFENDGSRILTLGPLENVDKAAYDKLTPVQWPVASDGSGRKRVFGSHATAGLFPTENGRARLFFNHCQSPFDHASETFPFSLNTGRLRDQWHTMTRTGLAPRLMAHTAEPLVDMHPRDAQRLFIQDGQLAEISSAYGKAIFRVRVNKDVRPMSLFVPMHFSSRFAPFASANKLTAPNCDPISGQPEFKHSWVQIRPLETSWRGFLVTTDETVREKIMRHDAIIAHYLPQVSKSHDRLALLELASLIGGADINMITQALMTDFGTCEQIALQDSKGRFVRIAWVENDKLVAIFVATTGKGLPLRQWLVDQFDRPLTDKARADLLLGGPMDAPTPSPIICACFHVSAQEIRQHCANNVDANVAGIGAALKAGSNCGSCRGEIATIIEECRAQPANASMRIDMSAP